MAEILDHAYECDANWKGPELAASSDWIYTLSEHDIAELEAALSQVKSNGLKIPDIGKQHFPLPTLSKKTGRHRPGAGSRARFHLGARRSRRTP